MDKILDDVLRELENQENNQKSSKAREQSQDEIAGSAQLFPPEIEYKVVEYSFLKDEGFQLAAKPFKAVVLAKIKEDTDVEQMKSFYESQTKETLRAVYNRKNISG